MEGPSRPHFSKRNIKQLSLSHAPERKSTRQWKTILEQIKSRYCQRQFKQCLAQCLQHLQDDYTPTLHIHIVYLQFYAALAHESIARNLSAFSASKKTNLESALLLYKSALDGLALSHSSRMISSSSQSSGTPTTATSSGSSVKAISPSSSTSSLYSAASSAGVQECDDASTNAMKPSPLRIRKVVRFVEQESTDENCRQGESRSSSSSFTAASTDTWLYFNAISRYNTNLAELGIQLGAHIGAVDQLIAEARADKESKLMERSNKFAELRDLGYYEDEIKQTSKLERIELGRATSWKRRRFEPGRYQELCQRALQEL